MLYVYELVVLDLWAFLRGTGPKTAFIESASFRVVQYGGGGV